MRAALDRLGFPRPALILALVLLAGLWGAAVAVAGLNALYLALSFIGWFFIVADFRLGVVLLVVLMPLSRSSVFPHAMFGVTGLNPLNLLLAATLASCLLYAAVDGSLRRFLPRPLAWLYLAPLLVAAALGARHLDQIAPVFHMAGQLDFDSAGGYLREFLAKPLMLVVFALLVAAAAARTAQPERLLIPGLLAVLLMASLPLVYVAAQGVALGALAGTDARGFLSALGMHANDLGRLYFTAYAMLLFAWAESTRPGLRLLLLVSMAAVAAALLLTFSRGAYFGFILVNLLFLLWRRNLRAFLFFGLLALGALVALPEAVYERLAAGRTQGLNAITAGRIEGLWLPLLPEVLRSPFYGNGLGSILWSEAMRAGGGVSMPSATHPHNAFLEAALDLGLVGMALVCAFYAHLWRRLRALGADAGLGAQERGFYQGAAAALAALLVCGLTDGSLAPRAEQVFLWFAVGMMYGRAARRAGA
jgi:O-antigen ligase